jgi:hypothetical protein
MKEIRLDLWSASVPDAWQWEQEDVIASFFDKDSTWIIEVEPILTAEEDLTDADLLELSTELAGTHGAGKKFTCPAGNGLFFENTDKENIYWRYNFIRQGKTAVFVSFSTDREVHPVGNGPLDSFLDTFKIRSQPIKVQPHARPQL